MLAHLPCSPNQRQYAGVLDGLEGGGATNGFFLARGASPPSGCLVLPVDGTGDGVVEDDGRAAAEEAGGVGGCG